MYLAPGKGRIESDGLTLPPAIEAAYRVSSYRIIEGVL